MHTFATLTNTLIDRTHAMKHARDTSACTNAAMIIPPPLLRITEFRWEVCTGLVQSHKPSVAVKQESGPQTEELLISPLVALRMLPTL